MLTLPVKVLAPVRKKIELLPPPELDVSPIDWMVRPPVPERGAETVWVPPPAVRTATALMVPPPMLIEPAPLIVAPDEPNVTVGVVIVPPTDTVPAATDSPDRVLVPLSVTVPPPAALI